MCVNYNRGWLDHKCDLQQGRPLQEQHTSTANKGVSHTHTLPLPLSILHRTQVLHVYQYVRTYPYVNALHCLKFYTTPTVTTSSLVVCD